MRSERRLRSLLSAIAPLSFAAELSAYGSGGRIGAVLDQCPDEAQQFLVLRILRAGSEERANPDTARAASR